MKKQILRNLFTNYLANLLGMILGFALVPFLVGKLGQEAYGLIVLAESSIIFFEVLKGSIWSALSRYATFALARERRDEFIELLSTGRVMLLAAAGFSLSVGAAVSFFFPSLFQVPATLGRDSRVLFFLITVSFSASLPNLVYWAVLYAKNRYDLLNLSMSCGVVLRALAVFGLFSASPELATLPVYGLVYLGMVAAQNAMVYLLQRRILPGVRVRVRLFRLERMREMLGYGSAIAVSRVSEIFYQQSPHVIVNLFWGSAANAVYSIGYKFPHILTRLFEEAAWSMTSSFNHLAALHRRDRVEALYFFYTKALTLVTAPLCFALVLYAGPLIRVWVGEAFSTAAQLIPIFVAPLFLQLPLCVGACITNAYGKVRVPSLVGLAVSFATLGMAILFGKVLGYGLHGVALSVALSSMFYYVVFQPHYANRIIGVSSLRYFREAFFLPLGWAAAASVAAGAAGGALLDAGVPWAIPPVLAVCAAVYAGGSFALVLHREERKYMMEILGHFSWRTRARSVPAQGGAVAAQSGPV